MKLKNEFQDSLVKAILRLSRLEKSTMNPYMKKEIQDEISHLVLAMTGLDDFVAFLLEKLQSEERIRANERLRISLQKKPKSKTGPLGNPIQEPASNES